MSLFLRLLVRLLNKRPERNDRDVTELDVADYPPVQLITLQEAGRMFDRVWRAEVEHSDGSSRIVESSSLGNLLNDHPELPAFSERGTLDSIRLRVCKRATLTTDDLLGLVQFNQGAAGLDISECNLRGIELTDESVLLRRHQFYRSRGFDPAWYQYPRGLYLRGLTANKVVLVGAALDSADLGFATLNGAYFEDSSLRFVTFENAEINGADFSGADLRGARFSNAKARGATFSSWGKSAQMDGVSLFGTDLEGASFKGVNLQGLTGLVSGTSLRKANLQGASLVGTNFAVLDAGALEGVMILDAALDRTQVQRTHFGAAIGEEILARAELSKGTESWGPERISIAELFDRASDAYLLLTVNFGTIGRTGDASWAHYKQREMLLASLKCRWKTKRDLALLSSIVREEFFRVTTGYGEYPLRPIVTAGISILIFALVFFGLGAFTGDQFLPHEALIYSGASFFAMSFGSYQTTCWITQVLTVAEAGWGIVVFGLFLWTIANTAGRY